MITIQSAYKREKHAGISFLDEDGNCLPTKTKQSFKEECDINNIVKKYDKGRGLLTHVNHAIAQYGDFTEKNEYQDALNLLNQSRDNFAKIPSEIRRQFDNDPGEFLEFAGNPANLDKMVEMGLAIKPTPIKETITKVEVINPETTETTKE